MNIFIGCSSKEEISKEYLEHTQNILTKIAPHNNLVFGVYHLGIMGLAYNEFKKQKRKVIGITNDTYQEEYKIIPCDEEYVVSSTLDRTKNIIEKSDIFLFLPGGLGTYAELFHIYEELRTYNIDKKIIIYNYNNYYSNFINIINNLIEEKFMDKTLLKYITIIDNEQELINTLKNSFVS